MGIASGRAGEGRKKNEELKEKNEKIKRLLLPFSILFIFAFGVWILSGNIQSPGGAAVFLTGLFITMYVFYTGLSAWIICYVKKKGMGVAMGNAQDKVKQAADYVTLSHNEDGVANVINKFMTPASKKKESRTDRLKI